MTKKKDDARFTIQITLTQEEKLLIEKAAAAVGCPQAVFVRMKALEGAKIAQRTEAELSSHE